MGSVVCTGIRQAAGGAEWDIQLAFFFFFFLLSLLILPLLWRAVLGFGGGGCWRDCSELGRVDYTFAKF